MIGRVAQHAGSLIAGVVIGALVVLASGIAPGVTSDESPAPSEVEASGDAPPGTGSTPGPDDPEEPAPVPTADESLLLVWTVGGLADDLAAMTDQVDGVREVTEVVAGRLDLLQSHDSSGTVMEDLDPGWAVPLDAIAVDPVTFTGFVPTGQRPALQRLEPGTAILGETSAELRGLGVGGQLTIAPGNSLTVVGVVDDASVGAAELVLHRDDPLAEAMVPSYLLLRHRTDRPMIETAVRELAGDRPVRVRAVGETPYLRHGDAVLPQAIVKQRYGEFAYRPPAAGERTFEIDQDWVAAHVVTREVPILGSVTCHRAAIESLAAVLEELDRRGLAHTVDPDGFAGCWHPRLISLDGGLSRHSWGIAVDVNAQGNSTGTGSGQHDALIELFTEAGWGWGGTWLVPDPMHFELVDGPSLPIKARP